MPPRSLSRWHHCLALNSPSLRTLLSSPPVARPGRATGGDDNNVLRLGEFSAKQWCQRESDRGGIAARVGDPPAHREPATSTGKFGQTVGPGAGMRAAVELLPACRVAQPEIGAKVDDKDMAGQISRDAGRLPVRQR